MGKKITFPFQNVPEEIETEVLSHHRTNLFNEKTTASNSNLKDDLSKFLLNVRCY